MSRIDDAAGPRSSGARALHPSVVAGTLLIWVVLGFVGYAAGWTFRSHRADQAIVHSVHSQLSTISVAGCRPVLPSSGQVAGILSIPSLHVKAPVEQGLAGAVLDVAVGHASQSVWPGQGGSAVFLAHDVSYFSRIDELAPGSVITFQGLPEGCRKLTFEVTGHDVVPAGSPIAQQAEPSMVLDTCWPVNALWYTPNRYLVRAVEVGGSPSRVGPHSRVNPHSSARSAAASRSEKAHESPPGKAGVSRALREVMVNPSSSWSLPASSNLEVPAPAALVAQGLTLQDNEAPMGAMALLGSPASSWAESPAPLEVEASALEEYFGALHALSQGEAAWWADLAPGVTFPQIFDGTSVVAHDSGLDVTITAEGTHPLEVILSSTVGLSGASVPGGSGAYRLEVKEAVEGGSLFITTWSVTPA